MTALRLHQVVHLPMQLEPRHLNVPLERRQSWALWLTAACAMTTVAIALVSAAFAKAFAASCIAVGPALWLLLAPPRPIATIAQRGGMMRVLVYACFFGYLSFARQVLLPTLLGVMA